MRWDNSMNSQSSVQFRRDGFVCLPGFLAADDVQGLREHLDLFIRDRVPEMPRQHVFFEDRSDPSSLKQLQELFRYDDFFHGLMFGSRFESVAEALLGGDVRGVNLQYFNKPPRIGRATPPHQDGFYFMLEPAEAVTMWLALDAADEENGCVRYLQGSHQQGMRPHGRTTTLGFSQGISDYSFHDRQLETACPANPGDLLVHHAMTIHRADANTSSDRSRRALGLIYYSATAVENPRREEQRQELARELEQDGLI